MNMVTFCRGAGDNSLEECKATADCAAKDSQILQTNPSLYVFLQHYTQFSSIKRLFKFFILYSVQQKFKQNSFATQIWMTVN